MKKGFITLVFLVFLSLSRVPLVSAHEIQRSGSIEVELHIDPNDSPMESSDSHLGFEVTDGSKHFDTSKCQCVLTIKKDQFVFFESEIEDLEVPFVFTENGEYEVVLRGWPKKNTSFAPFTVTFPVRVLPKLAKPTVVPQDTTNGRLNIYVSSIVIFLLVILSIYVNSKSKR